VGAHILHMTVLNGGGFLLVGCVDKTGRVVDMKTKKMISLTGHTGFVRCVIGCDDADVLTCSSDGTIRRWNRSTGECIRTYIGHNDCVYSILYEKETKRIFSGSADRTILVWDAETGENVGVMKGHKGDVFSLAFLNSTKIVSSSADGMIKLWDATTFTEVKTILSHTSSVLSVAVSPDGQYVVSGSGDKSVRVSSVSTGKCIATFSHHSDYVYKVAISPDGRFIASGGGDKAITLLQVSPPFPVIIHEGYLTDSSQTTSHHQMLSDGMLLRSGEPFCKINQPTICSLIPQTSRFLVESCNQPTIFFSAPSEASAQMWVEAVSAVRNNLCLQREKRCYSSQEMISRYRFDLLQIINFHKKSSVQISKDVMKIIGNYSDSSQ
jgi:hypothetical protein